MKDWFEERMTEILIIIWGISMTAIVIASALLSRGV